MLSVSQKNTFREELFRHLDGIVMAPVVQALEKKGILQHLLEKESCTLASLTNAFQANEGYLNVALRLLASQGWLEYDVTTIEDTITIRTNPKSQYAFHLANRYESIVDFLRLSENFHPRNFELEQFTSLNRIFTQFRNGYFSVQSEDPLAREIESQIEKHIEGAILGPIVVHLGMDGMFHKYFMEASFAADEFHEDPISFSKILDFLTHLGWFEKRNSHYRFTDKGLFFARRSSAYGVTVSYLPTFRRLDELVFGNAAIFKSSDPANTEMHVDREMNVWGSGGAHSAYFKKIDEIIIDLFNRPIEEQPKGILDMGCGNGAFLIHLFEVIEQRTSRGALLEEHPLFLVGVDYNRAALKVTRGNLIKADIWAKVIWGDIANPEQLETDLRENYEMELSDLLNVRTFLDHNRPWVTPKNPDHTLFSTSTGAFASIGNRLSNALVEQNLREHLERWIPYIEKFGLLLIELHTINPKLTSQNIGKTAATAYDATHGFSDQYILELDVFIKVLNSLGLESDPKHFSKYPNNELATVSIHYILPTS